HGIAVVQNLAGAACRRGRLLSTGLKRDFLILIDRKVVAAVGVLLWVGRPIRRAARIAVVEDLALRRRGRCLRRDRYGHAGRLAGAQMAARRARGRTEGKKDHASKVTHGVTLLLGR